MPSTFMRRAAAPFVAAAVLATGACGMVGVEFTAPTEHVAITEAKELRPAKAIYSAEGDKPGLLLGPHYTLMVSGYTTAQEIDDEQAGVYGMEAPMAVPDGSEYFLAVMDGKSEVQKGAKVKAELDVDGKKRPLDRMPGPSEAIAAVVPTGASVVLSVTDEERTQSVNLRDGKRSEQIDGYYNGGSQSPDLADYDGKGKVTADAGSMYEKEKRTLNLDMTVGAAQRSPWIDSAGWAADGKVWITVPVSDMITDAVYGFKPGSSEPGVDWTLKERDMFSLNPNEGKTVDPKGKESFKADQGSQAADGTNTRFDPSSVTLLFEVSDKTTKAELKIAPGGKMKAVWANVTGKCSWDDKPSSKTIDVSFA